MLPGIIIRYFYWYSGLVLFYKKQIDIRFPIELKFLVGISSQKGERGHQRLNTTTLMTE